MIVYSPEEDLVEKARNIAEHIGAILVTDETELQELIIATCKDLDNKSLYLCLNKDGLSLTDGRLSMKGDLTKNVPRLTHANLSHELLVKAAKIKGESGAFKAVDATAGMGEDALLLAAAGFEVDLYEYDPIIAALLKDSLERANECEALKPFVRRMHLHEQDSIKALNAMLTAPNVILLDPMFPERNKSAMIKKKFQLLQQLELPCENENALLQAALDVKPHKIIIKRPLKGPYLAGVKPSYSLEGKAIRYDCLLL